MESREDAKAAGRFATEERQAKETEAVQRASAKMAMQRKALRDNSLFTGGGGAGSATATTATGRTTLGV